MLSSHPPSSSLPTNILHISSEQNHGMNNHVKRRVSVYDIWDVLCTAHMHVQIYLFVLSHFVALSDLQTCELIHKLLHPSRISDGSTILLSVSPFHLFMMMLISQCCISVNNELDHMTIPVLVCQHIWMIWLWFSDQTFSLYHHHNVVDVENFSLNTISDNRQSAQTPLFNPFPPLSFIQSSQFILYINIKVNKII